MCHICKAQYPLPKSCPSCRSGELGEYGMGTQKVSEYIEEKFNTPSIIIEANTANSVKKIETITKKIHSTKPQIVIGTSLLSTPIQNYPLDLIHPIKLNSIQSINTL